MQVLVVLLLLFNGLDCARFSTSVFNATGSIRLNNDVHPESVFYTNSNSHTGTRIRGMRDTRNADFVLGGLFAVHSNIGGGGCGETRSQGGIDRVEAMLFALDNINSNPCLLPNITLGYDIRDTCFVEQIGLDEAADIILSGTQMGTETQCSVGQQSLGTNTSNETSSAQTIGIVGAGSSPVSIPIAGLGRLFAVPQISYSSTSAVLSNRERYTYFYRTVPSDDMEAKAMIDLMQYYDWTYISTIFSRNSYGQSGIDDLHFLASKSGICIDINEGIEETYNESDYRALIERLSQSTANVVVLYATQQHVKSLFKELEKFRPSPRHFTWIASSAWAQLAPSLPQGPVAGLFGTIPRFSHISHFQDYYSGLTPANNVRNPWFPEFYRAALNCTDSCDNETSIPTLSEMEQEYSIPLVIDAVYTFAHALEQYIKDSCDTPLVWDKETQTCNGQQTTPLNSSELLEYIANINFTSPTGNTVTFNEEGSIQALYEIINYQSKENGMSFGFQRIGIWDSAIANLSSVSVLKVNKSVEPQFGIDFLGIPIQETVRSECGACIPGEYLRMVEDSCCGFCDNCLGELFSNTSRASGCSNCSLNGEMWGDNSTIGSTYCVEIPKTYLRFSDPFAIVIMIASITGIVVLIVTFVLLKVFWKSPVIKASSRESIILMLIGVGCSFAASFIYLAPPSIGICSLQRMLIWFCFSLMYGSLMVKVIRIARIFVLPNSMTKHLRCMKTYHQVLFSLLVVAIQMVIVLISLLAENPRVLRDLRLSSDNPNALPEIVVTCQPEPLLGLVISVLYEAGLILVTVVLGTLTFKSPANFNESKAIAASAYILLSIWTMFFVSYIFTQSTQYLQNAFIALTNTLGAYAILTSFVGPRFFVIFFWKERNSKQFSRRPTEGDVWVDATTTSTTRDNGSCDGISIDAELDTTTSTNVKVLSMIMTMDHNNSSQEDEHHTDTNGVIELQLDEHET